MVNSSTQGHPPARGSRRRSRGAAEGLTPERLATLVPNPDKAIEIGDEILPCLKVQISPYGHKAWVLRYRIAGQPTGLRTKIGDAKRMHVTVARQKALELLAIADAGDDPRETLKVQRAAAKATRVRPKDTLKAVTEKWVRAGFPRRSRRHGLSESELKERKRRLDKYVIPALGEHDIEAVTHKRIVDFYNSLLPRVNLANKCVGDLRQLFKWWRGQTGTFNSPIISDDFMRAVPHRTKRTLTDEELVAIWQAADSMGTYGRIIKTLLLTGARLGEVLRMERDQIVDGIWTLPETKNHEPLVLPLSAEALRVIAEQPVINNGTIVFSLDGEHQFGNDAKNKVKLDAASGVTGWRQHDLRGQAKTMMMRAGISKDVAEAVLNHKAQGIEALYGEYDFMSEKREALRRLALLIGGIVGLEPIPPRD